MIGQLYVDKLNFLTLFELSNLQRARSLDFQDQVWEGQRGGVREVLLCTVGREEKLTVRTCWAESLFRWDAQVLGPLPPQHLLHWRRENQVLFPLPSLSPFCPG